MKIITKYLSGLLLLAVALPSSALAQTGVKEKNGYLLSKKQGAVSSLMKWSAFKSPSGKMPAVDPHQKLLQKIGIKSNPTAARTANDYQFYGGDIYKGNNIPYAAVTDAEGNTYITGASSNEDQPAGDFFTMKVGAGGETIWQKREPAAKYAVEYGMQIVFDNTGNIIVSGLKWNGNDMDIRVIKYSADGTKLWENTFDNGTNGLEIPNALTTGPDGSIYITGITATVNTVSYLTLKYNNNGAEQWHKSENTTEEQTWSEATAITVDGNDNVIVTGYSPNPEGWLNYHTVKYNNLGTKLWEQDYNYESTDPDNVASVSNSAASAITTDTAGNIYVTGTFDLALQRIGTIKYSANGQVQWVETYKSGNDQTLGLKLEVKNNNLYVAGVHVGGFSEDGTVLLSYNLSGTQNWVQETTNMVDSARGLLNFDNNGNIIVSANGMTPGAEEWQLNVAARAYKYSPEGNLLGESAFVISTEDGTASMAGMAGASVDNTGNIYFSVNSYYSAIGSVFETVKSSFGTTSPENQWHNVYSNLGSSDASMLNSFADGNGNTISTGVYTEFTNGMLLNNYFVTKHNAQGNAVWNTVYNVENGNPAEGIIARPDTSGNVYVCLLPGFEVYPPQLKVMKLSPAGASLWSTQIQLYSPSVYVMEPQPDGSVYLGGTAYENEDSGRSSFIGIKLNANGGEEWKTYIPGIEGNNIFRISAGKVDNNGNLVLAGAHGSGNFMSQQINLTAVKFNVNGAPAWITPVAVAGESTSGTDLYIAQDNAIYINGYTQNTETFDEDIIVTKLSSNGDVLWTNTFGEDDKNERSYTVRPFSNGDVATIGYSLAINGDIHNVLVKHTAAGEQLWNYSSENMRYYNDFHIDGSDKCYIMNQVQINPFPHKIFDTPFPIASLTTVDANGGNSDENFFIGPEYAEFYGERLVPHQDNRLLLAGSVANESFYKGLYFFETEHDGTLNTPTLPGSANAKNALGQNYPNPAEEKTTIPFVLINGGKATIKLFDVQGRFVKDVASGTYAAGTNTVTFNTVGMAPGVYFYQITSDRFKQAKKIIIK